jgi:chromate reductase, NAD(P)H dehydrogenase (quinone)
MNVENHINVIAFSGSFRKESLNKKALKVAVKIAADLGVDVREIDLNEFDLPVFNADLRENGFPESVVRLKKEIDSADVLLIATPEYNHSVPASLKNAIDWASDKTNPFAGKVAAIFGASTGMFGTLRAQLHLRQILAALKVEILPQPQVFIRSAGDAFNPDGGLADEKIKNQLRELIEKTLNHVRLKKGLSHS